MERYTLERTGDRPLVVEGDRIAEESSRSPKGWGRARWHEIAVYRTGAGRYVAHVVYRTQWEGEVEYAEAIVCDSAAELAAELRAYDPTAHVLGYPVGKQFAERQERLLRDLRLRYEAAMGRALRDVEPEVLD